MQLFISIAVALVGLCFLYVAIKSGRYALAMAAAILCIVMTTAAWTLLSTRQVEVPQPKDLGLAVYLPQPLEPEHGFAGSQSCQSCHPQEHASWHKSYHRTMTQPATPQAIVAPFDGVTLSHEGKTYHLQRSGDEYLIDMVDPDWEREQILSGKGDSRDSANPPRVTKRVVMATGSHHKQTYWVPSSQSRFLIRLPWTYRIDDQRWIPSHYDFLVPPNKANINAFTLNFWDSGCIQCHAVAGQPRFNPRTMNLDSHVAELGIACEACHGPAAEHVRIAQEAQDRGIAGPASENLTSSIVNPLELSSKKATQICGQCHSWFFPRNAAEFETIGHTYRAGDDLHETRHVVIYGEEPQGAEMKNLLAREPRMIEYNFWKDGTIRVTGRDYNGLLKTPCYQRGELSCISCHSLHGYEDRDDQLAPGMRGNKACLQCHDSFKDKIEQHTHHPANSSGSLCYNCHMPHTTYGLFKAVRSHRIDSPSVANSVSTGRPNACNLCHLDKTQAWSADHLSKWYDLPAVELEQDDKQIAASLLWLLRGNAVQRAIVSWHMGWEPARKTSGEEWIAPFLAHGLSDPYAAVRNVAQRSLRKLPGFSDLDYDFLAPEAELAESTRQAVATWTKREAAPCRTGLQILIEPPRNLRQSTVERLMQQRDTQPVRISE